MDFQEKMIEVFTTTNFYLKLKENNENDMTAHAFWIVFCSSQQLSQIGPTAENDGAAVPSPIFFLAKLNATTNFFSKVITESDQIDNNNIKSPNEIMSKNLHCTVSIQVQLHNWGHTSFLAP